MLRGNGDPQRNWCINTVEGGLLHRHWILRPGGELNAPHACTRGINRSVVGGRCGNYLLQVCRPGTYITVWPQEILKLIPDWCVDLDPS